jgi:predicted RNase H-like HicB family nuclease/uncharacterized protein YjbI with pentapeptide repeats
MTTLRHYCITAEWDTEAGVWVAASDDVPGLVTGADSLDDLTDKLNVVIPELLEANGIIHASDVGDIRFTVSANQAGTERRSAGKAHDYSPLVKETLRQAGCAHARDGKDGHEFWFSPVASRRFVVDANIKSLAWANQTLKQAGPPNQMDLNRARQGKKAWNEWAVREFALGRLPIVDFSQAKLRDFDFSGFKFPGPVHFIESSFASVARFKNAEFLDAVWFDKAKFDQGAEFQDAAFTYQARFHEANFNDHAFFNGAKFFSMAGFLRASFSRDAQFQHASFYGLTRFDGARFGGSRLMLESTSFASVPDFRYCSFQAPPILGATRISYALDSKASRNERCFAKAADGRDASRYRRLKQLAADAKDHESELRFFADELRAKRFYETKGRWPIALNVLYEWLSDFGRSIFWPLSWLVGSIFAAVFAILAQHADKFPKFPNPVPESTLGTILAIAATNALALVGGEKSEARQEAFKKVFCAVGQSECGKELTLTLTLVGHWLVYLQGAFSLLLFFLIGLALRNRFRIGGGG